MTTNLIVCLIAALYVGAQAPSKPPFQGPDVRRVCLEGLDVHVGDTYEKVATRLALSPDADTPARFTSTGPDVHVANGGTLRSALALTFDTRRRLRSVTVAWTYDGEQTAAARDAVLTLLTGEVHSCLKGVDIATDEGVSRARIDYGTYSERFELDSTGGGRWRIHYTISEEP
jgi:hypothetical protein